jgi:hypothetical protein
VNDSLSSKIFHSVDDVQSVDEKLFRIPKRLDNDIHQPFFIVTKLATVIIFWLGTLEL